MAQYTNDFRQGETKTITIDYGSGCDITGWEFWFTIRSDFDDADPVAQAHTTAGDDANDDVTAGLAHITLDSDVSALIEAGKYYYDLRVSKGGTPPIIKTLFPPIDDYKDKITIIPSVTKVSA